MLETRTTPDAGATAIDDVATRRRLDRREAVVRGLEAYALLGLLLVLVLFFAVFPETSDTFLTSANLQILVGNQAVLAIVALAALIPLVCNEFDLSVGPVAGLSSIFVASALSDGTPVVVAILIGIGIGAGVGLVNALLVTKAGINGVITTLGMATVITGVIVQRTGGVAVVSDIPASVTGFGTENFLGVPRVAYVLAVVAAGVYYLLAHTPFGRKLYALGSNPTAARLVGIRTNLMVGSTFVLAGTLAGAAGVLQVARAGGADPRVGDNFTLPALAAAFLSAAAVRPGRYNVGGALIAIFFIAVLNSGLNLAGAPQYLNSYVNGAALIVGVGMAAFLHRRRARA